MVSGSCQCETLRMYLPFNVYMICVMFALVFCHRTFGSNFKVYFSENESVGFNFQFLKKFMLVLVHNFVIDRILRFWV